MRLQILFSYLVLALQAVLATPPPQFSRVLVIVDNVEADVDASTVASPLNARGFEVQVASLKDRPQLLRYGERVVDNVVIIPGKTKALGSTLRAVDLLDFMKLGGNVVALTTPKHSPASLREIAHQLGIEVGGRGVEARNNFAHAALFPHPAILPEIDESADLFSGSAVAKINENNSLALGLVQAPYSAYAYNAAKEDGDEPHALTDPFGLGSDLFVSAALQSHGGARFVWVGSPKLLADAALAESITGWAFQERGLLRIANATHKSMLTGEHHLHYKVEEPLKFCAQIEQWVPEVGGWVFYPHITDVQFEFRMLDPYYRLPLGEDGCVEFKTPEQYGMFTFSVDYKRPGLTFLEDKQVVTVRHRANDEWDRSWTITNSWVYLSGVSTTVIGFVLFIFIYLGSPEPSGAVIESENTKKTEARKTETRKSDVKKGEAAETTPSKAELKQAASTETKRTRRRTRN